MTTITDLWIDERLSKLCPSLADEELRQLEANVLRDGKFTDPLLYCRIDGNPYLIDGVNRLDVWNSQPADTTVKPPKLEEVNGIATFEEAEDWILNHQFGRRNMTPEGMRALRVRWTAKLKERERATEPAEGVFGKFPENPLVAPKGGRPKSAEAQVAEKTHTDVKTVKSDLAWDFAVKRIGLVDKQTEDDIRNGKLKAAKKGKVLAVGQLQDDAKVLSAIKEWRKPNPPKPKKERKPKSGTSVSPAKLVDELRRKHVGPLVRGIDAVAKINGGKGPCHQAANDALDKLESALKQMREGQA